MKALILASGIIAALPTSTALAQSCANSGSAKVGVVEIVQFRLADGIARDDFLAAAAATMPVLCATGGVVERTLSEGNDGTWVDYVKWTSPDLAQAAMAASIENAALRRFILAIDADSVTQTYQTPVDLP